MVSIIYKNDPFFTTNIGMLMSHWMNMEAELPFFIAHP